LVNDNGTRLGTVTKGVAQGSVIGPMICNVLLNVTLYGKSPVARIFEGLKSSTYTTSRSGEPNKQRRSNIYRHIITYADDAALAITTTHKEEIPFIMSNVSSALETIGLRISMEKSRIITYDTNDKIKFDYLGFTFYYVPKTHIKRGGLLTRHDAITERKNAKTEDGTYLVYPSKKNYDGIKLTLRSIIRKLTNRSMTEVLNELNPIIRGYCGYFC
jgi:RNA-directed DNA polymerase